MADAEIEDMRRKMTDAAMADTQAREQNLPAMHKLKLLPSVVALLNRKNLAQSIVDPDINLLEAIRFFLEPLSDGSLPAYNIQRELFAALGRLPINKDSLIASGIGKVVYFYTKSKRPELTIKRQAERLLTEWMRPILKRTDDYRQREVLAADYDPKYVPARLNRILPLLTYSFPVPCPFAQPKLKNAMQQPSHAKRPWPTPKHHDMFWLASAMSPTQSPHAAIRMLLGLAFVLLALVVQRRSGN